MTEKKHTLAHENRRAWPTSTTPNITQRLHRAHAAWAHVLTMRTTHHRTQGPAHTQDSTARSNSSIFPSSHGSGECSTCNKPFARPKWWCTGETISASRTGTSTGEHRARRRSKRRSNPLAERSSMTASSRRVQIRGLHHGLAGAKLHRTAADRCDQRVPRAVDVRRHVSQPHVGSLTSGVTSMHSMS